MKLGTVTTTDMACNELNGSFEGEFMSVLTKANRYELKGNTLTLTDTATGHYMRFENMSGTTEPPVGSDETQHEIFYIANRTAKCAAISPQRCLLIKKEKDGTWEKYYDSIIGFTPKPGRFYKIEVARSGDPPSGLPGDVTIYRHKLVHIVRSSTRERDIYR